MSALGSAAIVTLATFVTVLAAARLVRVVHRRRRRAPSRRLPPSGDDPCGSVSPGAANRWVPAVVAAVERLLARRPARAHEARCRRTVEQLDGIGAALRSGASLAEAVAGASTPLPQRACCVTTLDALADDLGRGAALVALCRARADGAVDQIDRLVAGALALAAAGGGEQARAVDATAEVLRDRLAIAGEIRAQSAQAMLSGLVLAGTPLLFTAWSAATDQRVRRFLLGDPVGLGCLGAGVALDALGAWWMARLCRAVQR